MKGNFSTPYFYPPLEPLFTLFFTPNFTHFYPKMNWFNYHSGSRGEQISKNSGWAESEVDNWHVKFDILSFLTFTD